MKSVCTVDCHPDSELGAKPPDHIWLSEIYNKSYLLKDAGNAFRYYDTTGVLKFLFFHWVIKWLNYTTRKRAQPYNLPPLLVADQVLRWQPVFSKHLSDGLVRLEACEASKSNRRVRKRKPYKSILVRALFLTLWKRLLLVFVGIVLANTLSMSIAIVVKRLLKIMNENSRFGKVLGLLTVVILMQMSDGIVMDNFNYYTYRLVAVVHYLILIDIFQHGFCYRRKYCNEIDGTNVLGVCNSVLHSCSPESQCSKNPLYCPARRHQHIDITPNVFSLQFNDGYYISLVVESLKIIVAFLSSFIYGMYLISAQVNVDLWALYVMGVVFVFFMISFEILNTIILAVMFSVRDYRAAKSTEILLSLPLVEKMGFARNAINIITRIRNRELCLYFLSIFLSFFNLSMNTICANSSFYIIVKYFIKSVISAGVITEIDTPGFMTTFYVFLRIVASMLLLPHSIKFLSNSIVCLVRTEKYFRGCSPNFYNTSNKFIGSAKVSSVIDEVTKELPKDTVVLFEDATFTWVNSRSDLLSRNYQPYLRNVNFHLKRGEVAVVTGSMGSGKSNLIKAVLGEMTLVEGAMAVVPLHTEMPIFYSSQDVWLHKGTVRSNITFGYKFDEQLYHTVLRAVELEFDISTWEDGDLRFLAENGHSLSGGQRVRVALARAVYAYLVFNKVNREYNDNKCSFLMCLDEPFNSLDPFVARTIFTNLFNLETGLLVKGDLSVVLTSTKTVLEMFTSSLDPGKFPTIPLYNIRDQRLLPISTLADFIDKKPPIPSSMLLKQVVGPYNMPFLSAKMLNACSDDTRATRQRLTKLSYGDSFRAFKERELSGVKFNPYLVYFTPSMATFVTALILTTIMTVLDDIKMVVATNLSDRISKSIKDHETGEFVDLLEIKSMSGTYLKIVSFLVAAIIILALVTTVLFAISALVSSRKIHEYCLKSVFKHNAFELKVKKQMDVVLAFLICDIKRVDERLCYSFSSLTIKLIGTIINIVTVFYLVPLSIPFLTLCLILVYKYLFSIFVNSCANVEYATLETNARINDVYDVTVSASSVYRSFKKENVLVCSVSEHNEYQIRCMFYNRTSIVYFSLVFNWIFSLTTLFVLVVLVVFDRFTGFKFTVGYLALALSLCMNVIKKVMAFSFDYAIMQIYMTSIRRFQYFVPKGQKVVFERYINTNEEDLLVNNSSDDWPDIAKLKSSLLRRRKKEFREENRRLYMFRRLGFKPRFNFHDVSKCLTPDHSGLELKDVYVFTTPERSDEGVILRGLTLSAHRSDIVGIIGRTGAGKTSLLSVLENTATGRTGQVLLDGVDLNDVPKPVLRHIIGTLPQHPFVFKGWTVRRFLDPRRLFTDDEISHALSKCGLLEFVNGLKGGRKLDTVVVPENLGDYMPKGGVLASRDLKNIESDMLLSMSQLRTVAIARLVLYRKLYRVVLVDEPPGDVESDTSTKTTVEDLKVPIYEMLKKHFQHCTTFVTAHDSNALKACNRVWALHRGSFMGEVSVDEVLKENSISKIVQKFSNPGGTYMHFNVT